MINLIPPAARRTFTAGRVNALLIRYIWIVIALFGLLAIISGLAYVMLETTKQSAQQQITSNNTDVKNLQYVQVRSDTFAANLAISKTILDQQTHYTDAILKISALIVPGTFISGLSLDETAYDSPMTLQVSAKDEQAALRLKTSLQDSGLFSDVHFLSLALGGGESGGPDYPVSAQLVATIIKEGL